MLNREQGWSKTRAELLMDITACVAQHLQRPEDFRHIPAHLARVLGLEPLSLAVVQTLADESLVLLGAHSGTEAPPAGARDILALHERTRHLATPDGPAPGPSGEWAAFDLGHAAAFPHVAVFPHAIDDRHRLLLVIHTRAGDPGLPAGHAEILQLLARQLAKGLESLVIWMARPGALGVPFDRLTAREWVIFRSLNTDGSEKQLAGQLGVSPHTLHSHIKSIYRKVGVQGRLPLLRLADDTLRDLRLRRFNSRPNPEILQGAPHAVAAG
jgi:DNA-binding CsgD family transcriptional regulator